MSAETVSTYREEILETLKNQFLARLDTLVENSREKQVSDSEIVDLKEQYVALFSSLLSNSLDSVFFKDLTELPSEVDSSKKDSEQIKSSLTVEDLQNLDDAVQLVCHQRKAFPAKYGILLEKSLQSQALAAEKIRAKIKSVPKLTDSDLQDKKIEQTTRKVLIDLEEDARKSVEKARRICEAMNILVKQNKATKSQY